LLATCLQKQKGKENGKRRKDKTLGEDALLKAKAGGNDKRPNRSKKRKVEESSLLDQQLNRPQRSRKKTTKALEQEQVEDDTLDDSSSDSDEADTDSNDEDGDEGIE
jgi:hypothetical protein